MARVVARLRCWHSLGVALLDIVASRFSPPIEPAGVRRVSSLTCGIDLCLFAGIRSSFTLTKQEWGPTRVPVCPFLLWAAFRFCQLEAAGATLIVFGAAIWGTLHGYGSFVAKNLATSLVALDTFIGVIGTMTLVVAAMVVERRRIESELLGTQSLLQEVLKRKERDLVVTVQALELEAASHAQTKRAFQENQGRSRQLGESAKPEEKGSKV